LTKRRRLPFPLPPREGEGAPAGAGEGGPSSGAKCRKLFRPSVGRRMRRPYRRVASKHAITHRTPTLRPGNPADVSGLGSPAIRNPPLLIAPFYPGAIESGGKNARRSAGTCFPLPRLAGEGGPAGPGEGVVPAAKPQTFPSSSGASGLALKHVITRRMPPHPASGHLLPQEGGEGTENAGASPGKSCRCPWPEQPVIRNPPLLT
jgi:hypothetical protein